MKHLWILVMAALLLAGCAKDTASVRIYKVGATGSYFGTAVADGIIVIIGGKPEDLPKPLHVKYHSGDNFVEYGGSQEEEENLE